MHLLLNIHRLSRMAACIVQPLSIYNTKLFNLDIRNKFLIPINHGNNLPRTGRAPVTGGF